MSCYHPLIRCVVGAHMGKCGHVVDTALFRSAFKDVAGRKISVAGVAPLHGQWIDILETDTMMLDHPHFVSGQMIRCGNCMGCRIDRSREWANRCLLELQYHQSAYFVTLTYSDDFVPVSHYADPSTGEAQPSLTLRKRDLQLFFKRLRKRHVKPLRYFAAGEYGGKTLRPHYHAIIFGLELGDLVPYGRNFRGEMTYTSDFLHSVWARRDAPIQSGSVTSVMTPEVKAALCTPYGRVVVAPVTWETCAYVARYTTKKLYSMDAKYYDEFGLEPPFLAMSTHPPIGDQYLKDHPELKDFEFICVATDKGGLKFRPPHSYERQFAKDLPPDEYEERRNHRMEIMQAARKAQMAQSSLTYGELLAVQEHSFSNRVKKLKRDGV